MKATYAIPTANPPLADACLARWQGMGYATAVLVDGHDHCAFEFQHADMIIHSPDYRGWPHATNTLCRVTSTEIVVVGGDDIWPDETMRADDIAAQFVEHFGGTFGVMQPTGDRFMPNGDGVPASERVAYSPWFGREFIERAYGGIGPVCESYYHFFSDEEIQAYAMTLDIFWQRPDVIQHHDHWTRTGRRRPDYMHKAQAHWKDDKATFAQRQVVRFPPWRQRTPNENAEREARRAQG